MAPSRRTFLAGVAAAAGATALSIESTPAASARPAAAAAAAQRLIGDHARQISFVLKPESGPDRFTIGGKAGAITISGTTTVALLTGLRWYLKTVVHADITWAGDQLELPDRLPAPAHQLTRTANVSDRFVFNDTEDGYAGIGRDWSDWEHELDVLALHGFNRVLVYIGADAVYHEVFQQFGYSSAELRAWIPGPAHQPWWLLQNMAGFPDPLSEQLLTRRAELGRKIADRARELGMTPVLPGYFGTVPPGFADRNSGAHVVPQGDWVGFQRPDWLDPRTSIFADVAAAFYRVQERLFGASTMYKMDLLHEGGRAGDVDVSAAAKAVETALRSAHPGAIWAILGWQTNPPTAIVDAVDKSRMLVVDGLSDRFPTITDREADWHNTPYAFGSIWNFGGHTVLGANTPDWAELYRAWLTKSGSALTGIALMPEGGDNNPAAFELFGELAWLDDDLDLESWFADFAVSRYGGRDRHAAAAWDILRRTVYGTTRDDQWSEGADGLYGARPALDTTSAAAWSPGDLRYDPTTFAPALDHLLAVAPALRRSSAYRRDLLDVARQVLSNQSRLLLPKIKKAYDSGDAALFGELSDTWLDLINLLDRLVATDPDHLAGRWVQRARSWGATSDEQDQLGYDALVLLTVWGNRSAADDGGLRDYANREWAGLLKGLYRLRWKTLFDEFSAALAESRDPAAIDWFALEDGWTRDPGPLPTKPVGDVYRIATEVHDTVAQLG